MQALNTTAETCAPITPILFQILEGWRGTQKQTIEHTDPIFSLKEQCIPFLFLSLLTRDKNNF